MGCIFLILNIVYILSLLPCHQCADCGTFRLLNTEPIKPGNDVLLEFSNMFIQDTSRVRWWKYTDFQSKPQLIDTAFQRFDIDVQHDKIKLIIHNFAAEDNGRYTASFGSECYPPKGIVVTAKEPKVYSIMPEFNDNVTIPELECERCLVGKVGVYMNVQCVVFGISENDLNLKLDLKKNGQDIPNVIVQGDLFYRASYGYTPGENDADHKVTCKVTGEGRKPVTVSITLLVLRKPSTPTVTLPDSIKEGEKAHISCKTVSARPEPRLYFIYNATHNNTSNSFSKLKGDKTVDAETMLEKTFSRYDNGGKLQCCVEFREYDKNTPNMKTNCTTAAIDVLFPPKFLRLEQLNKANDEEGNTTLLLQCTSDVSNPVSMIKWKTAKNITYKSSQKKDKVEELNGYVRTKTFAANITRHNNGETISCNIENPKFPAIQVFENYKLSITYKPIIRFTPGKTVTAYVDDRTTILCQVDANPSPKIKWLNTSPNEIGTRTDMSLEMNMRFQSTGRYNYTCTADNTIGSSVNASVFIMVKDQSLKPTTAITSSASPSTGKDDNSSSMLIGIICGVLALIIIAVIAIGCVVMSKRRKKTPTREGSYNVHIQERQPSLQLLEGPVYDNMAGSNRVGAPLEAVAEPNSTEVGAPPEAIAEPVEYACVVNKAERQATKPQTEDGALIYVELDLPTEGSTRRRPTVNLDAGTTYVSIDFAQTEKMKGSVLND